MLLSEAVRLGAVVGPQLFGQLADGTGATCAVGSAALSAGCLDKTLSGWDVFRWGPERLRLMFPILDHRPGHCPGGCDFQNQLASLVVHLNNQHRWTREQIADWVEEQEVTLGLLAAEDDEQPLPEPVPVGAAS